MLQQARLVPHSIKLTGSRFAWVWITVEGHTNLCHGQGRSDHAVPLLRWGLLELG